FTGSVGGRRIRLENPCGQSHLIRCLKAEKYAALPAPSHPRREPRPCILPSATSSSLSGKISLSGVSSSSEGEKAGSGCAFLAARRHCLSWAIDASTWGSG